MSIHTDRAKELLSERLLDGQNVNKVNTRDLLDDICQGVGNEVRYHELLSIMDGVLAMHAKGGDRLLLAASVTAQRLYDLVIPPFVEDQEDAVTDLAAELRKDAEADAAYERSVA